MHCEKTYWPSISSICQYHTKWNIIKSFSCIGTYWPSISSIGQYHSKWKIITRYNFFWPLHGDFVQSFEHIDVCRFMWDDKNGASKLLRLILSSSTISRRDASIHPPHSCSPRGSRQIWKCLFEETNSSENVFLGKNVFH